MWELIASNRRKSLVLFILLGACLAFMGYLLGSYYYPGGGGVFAMAIAISIWLIMSSLAYFSGDSILLAVSRARQVTSDVHPQLYNVVEEMKIAAGMPGMPKIYIMNEEALNAFAVGRNPENSAIVVTAGLLSKLNRDELQGVIAHEMSHIVNRDSLYMTFAGVTLGAIALLSNIFWYGNRLGGIRYRYGSSRNLGGAGQLLIPLLTILFVLVGTLMARLLYFAISRRREYLADASAVRLTRYPEGLASALEKISISVVPLAAANKVTAPLYISNPIGGEKAAISNWESTHPPISERIKILRSMPFGAGYNNYQDAFDKISDKQHSLLPKSALKDKTAVPIRKAQPETSAPESKNAQRALGDLMMTVNNYLFLSCSCGLKIKVPADLKQTKITCPRCGHVYNVNSSKAA
jgi:heat shock protein HtpX